MLRFVAAFMVVVFHVVPMIGLVYDVDVTAYFTHPVARLSRYGWLGVEFFFVISGFVICMSSWGRRLSQFATSRAVRLFPAYIVAVLIAAAILTVSPNPGFTSPSAVRVLVNLTMLQELVGVPPLDTAYWTLLVEVKFYLIFTLVVWAGMTYRRVVAFCAVWLLVGMLAQRSDTTFLVGLLEPRWTPFFVTGITLYLMHRFGANTILWCMLAAGFILCTHTFSLVAAEPTVAPLNVTVTLVIFTVFTAIMIAVALGWTAWLRWRGLVTIGALTYPLYLLHFHIVFFALRIGHGRLPDRLLTVLVIGGVLVLAYLVHRFVERPGGHAFRRGLQHSFKQMDTTRIGSEVLARTEPSRPGRHGTRDG